MGIEGKLSLLHTHTHTLGVCYLFEENMLKPTFSLNRLITQDFSFTLSLSLTLHGVKIMWSGVKKCTQCHFNDQIFQSFTIFLHVLYMLHDGKNFPFSFLALTVCRWGYQFENISRAAINSLSHNFGVCFVFIFLHATIRIWSDGKILCDFSSTIFHCYRYSI